MVIGANRDGYHLKDVSVARDCSFDAFTDIGFVSEGETCPNCKKGSLKLCKGIEVGQVFKLNDKYSSAMDMSFLQENGEPSIPTMGCYGIGVGRTAAASVEQNHDDNGIIWPAAIAPYTVAILCLDPDSEDIIAKARELHDSLEKAGIDVILDNRNERPGVKFKDADLIGFPIRVTIGARGLKNGIIEVKERTKADREDLPVDTACGRIIELSKAAV